LKITVSTEEWALAREFRISRASKTSAHVVLVTIDDGVHIGYGECLPYARYGESIDSVIEQIDHFSSTILKSPDRDRLRLLMPAGAARNALDCALLDLSCKQQGKRAWEILGIGCPQPVTTAFTLGMDSVDKMAANARENCHRDLLKIKLGPVDAAESVFAIHQQAPHSRLIVDANEAWTLQQLNAAMDAFAACKVELVEQPLPSDADADLRDAKFPIPLGADESCHTIDGLDTLRSSYQVINIKLDKTGGITEALHLKETALQMGLGIMVGCMVTTSLSMAPAMLLTQDVSWVDLDGPLLLKNDRPHGLEYIKSKVYPPSTNLWG
jgi:L-alanine-DL-glutamate epimerase-like enolase superfamily enzyme